MNKWPNLLVWLLFRWTIKLFTAQIIGTTLPFDAKWTLHAFRLLTSGLTVSDSEGSDSDGSYVGRKKLRRDEAEEVTFYQDVWLRWMRWTSKRLRSITGIGGNSWNTFYVFYDIWMVTWIRFAGTMRTQPPSSGPSRVERKWATRSRNTPCCRRWRRRSPTASLSFRWLPWMVQRSSSLK